VLLAAAQALVAPLAAGAIPAGVALVDASVAGDLPHGRGGRCEAAATSGARRHALAPDRGRGLACGSSSRRPPGPLPLLSV